MKSGRVSLGFSLNPGEETLSQATWRRSDSFLLSYKNIEESLKRLVIKPEQESIQTRARENTITPRISFCSSMQNKDGAEKGSKKERAATAA